MVPKKSGITVVQNEKGEEIATRLTSSWRVCIDYRKLNAVTRKYHFPFPFIDQVLERVSGHHFYCFLDGYSGIFKLKLMLKIKRRPLSHVHLEHTPTEECLLVCAMHLQHSKDVCLVSSVIWWSELWRFSWMISSYMEVHFKNA